MNVSRKTGIKKIKAQQPSALLAEEDQSNAVEDAPSLAPSTNTSMRSVSPPPTVPLLHSTVEDELKSCTKIEMVDESASNTLTVPDENLEKILEGKPYDNVTCSSYLKYSQTNIPSLIQVGVTK